jgi:hypothetical protein
MTPAEKLQPELAYMSRPAATKDSSKLFLRQISSDSPKAIRDSLPFRLKNFLRQEMPLVVSWLILAFYLGNYYLRQADQFKKLEGYIYEVRHALTSKLDEANRQASLMADTAARLSENFSSQETKLANMESRFSERLEQQSLAMQKMKLNLEEAQKQLVENNTKISSMEESRRQEMELIARVLEAQNQGSAAAIARSMQSPVPSTKPAPDSMALVNRPVDETKESN